MNRQTRLLYVVDDEVDAGGGFSQGCGSNLPTMPMPGTSSTLKIRYKDPNIGKVAMVMMMATRGKIIMNGVMIITTL